MDRTGNVDSKVLLKTLPNHEYRISTDVTGMHLEYGHDVGSFDTSSS